jgi:hypothetical protein
MQIKAELKVKKGIHKEVKVRYSKEQLNMGFKIKY